MKFYLVSVFRPHDTPQWAVEIVADREVDDAVYSIMSNRDWTDLKVQECNVDGEVL